MLSVASLIIMVVADLFLGAKAEFINAWSVLERLFGQPPWAGDSAVFLRPGAVGELMCVVLVNALIGGVLTFFVRLSIGK